MQPQGRKRVKAAAKQPAPKQASTAYMGKDTGLALFHALGKVLYNKKLDTAPGDASSSSPGTPPEHSMPPSWSKEIANYGDEQEVAAR